MRLKKLYIEHYKNIHSEYSFEGNQGYIALIGLNGSGKSNLLEAISLVLDTMFGLQVKTPIGNFWIEYEMDGETCFYGNIDQAGKVIELDSQPKMPSMLISCYSGEDDRLWNFCYKDYYVRFFNAAIGGGEYKPLSLYVNKYCWKIAFISLLFSENEEVKSFVKNILKVDAQQVTVQFTRREENKANSHDASNWYARIEEKFGKERIPMEVLKYEDLICNSYPNLTPDAQVFYYLYFLCMPERNLNSGMRADKLIENIDIQVNGYNFEDLSEGEKKLILIECITKVLGDEDALVLFDEPDAHTHIAMKKELLRVISEFEGQTIMTTHSPMFLNKRWDGYHVENIYYMHDGIVETADGLKHLSDLTDGAIDYFEGSFILSSKNILVTEGPYDIMYLKYAIDIFAREDTKYAKLNNIAFMHAGGASNAVAMYRETLYPMISKIEHLVFLFDYDMEGYNGKEKLMLQVSANSDNVTTSLFYQNNYGVVRSQRPKEKDPNSYILEDLFDSESYKPIMDKIHVESHKEIRNVKWEVKGSKRPKTIPEAIKVYIEENYLSFGKEWIEGFRPVLDKLIQLFNL